MTTLDLTPFLSSLPKRPVVYDIHDDSLRPGSRVWFRVPGRSLIWSGTVSERRVRPSPMLRVMRDSGGPIWIDPRVYVVMTVPFLSRLLGVRVEELSAKSRPRPTPELEADAEVSVTIGRFPSHDLDDDGDLGDPAPPTLQMPGLFSEDIDDL